MKALFFLVVLTLSSICLAQLEDTMIEPVANSTSASVVSEEEMKTKDLVKGEYNDGRGATYFLFARKAVQNLVEMPLEKIEDIFNFVTFSNKEALLNRGSRKLAKENDRKVALDAEMECAKDPSTVDKILNAIQKTDYCLCSAWNDCEKHKCSCATLCPFDMRIMRKTATQVSSPVQENQLHFRNHQGGIYKYEELTGFCWGHATVTQRMTQLSVFNPNKKAPYKEGSKDWVLYYKQIIDNLVSNNAQEVPSFKNLYEFSGHPALEEYIALKVSKAWAKQASELGNLSHFIRLGSKQKDNLKFFDKVKEYLDFGVSPVVVKSFRGLGDLGSAHVVVAYKYKENEDGSKTIYFNDNSEPIELNAKEKFYLKMDKNGNIVHSYDGTHLVDRHFKRDIVHQVTSMKVLCEEQLCK